MAGLDLVLMGRAAGAFGLKGEVKLTSFAQDDSIYQRAGVIFAGPGPDQARPLHLLSMRPHGGRLLVRLREIQTREEAAALGGQWVYLRRQDLDPLEEGEYYWFQLEGARVKTAAGRDLGRVKAVTDNGAHDMLVVEHASGAEVLIPILEEFVPEMDIERGLLVVDLPKGFLESQGVDQPD